MLNPIKTAITKGIKVTVYPKYIGSESRPDEGLFFHAYRISIQNVGTETMQLLKRHWKITDSLVGERIVQGDGIVGEQPVLEPGQEHSYTSFCPLKSSVGSMQGHFLFMEVSSEDLVSVKIPKFDLLMPGVFN